MSAYRAWQITITFAAFNVIASFFSGFAGIWAESDKLGATALMLGSVGVVLLVVCAVWHDISDLGNVKQKRAQTVKLSRPARAKLREAQERIALEKAILEAEKEAGVPHEKYSV